jgi:hypothetical protein
MPGKRGLSQWQIDDLFNENSKRWMATADSDCLKMHLPSEEKSGREADLYCAQYRTKML